LSTGPSFDNTTDTLAVSDGPTTASLHFLGSYAPHNFLFADDGNGGTIVYSASAPGQVSSIAPPIVNSNTAAAVTIGEHDTFIFAPNFGQVTISNFAPATDTLQFSHSVFANVSALLAATHNDTSGNAVITDSAHDTITIQHVTTAQLLANQSDLHFV